MLQELERKRAELMREVHAVSAAIKAYAETIGQPQRQCGQEWPNENEIT